MELDKELKQLRKENDITQEYLAGRLYVSIQTINKWENGKCLPDAINLLHIAQFYGISLDILMKNEIPERMKVKDTKKSSILKGFFNDIFLKKYRKS